VLFHGRFLEGKGRQPRMYEMGLSERRTLVVIDYVSKVVPSAVVRFSYAHRVVREVDIAVVAWGDVSVRSR
jgi:hypothetical protein